MSVATKTLILSEIADERRRQDQLLYEGKIDFDCAASHVPIADRFVVLAEEFGEVARAILDDDGEGLRTELIQLAAVAVAILESLE